MFTVYVCKVTPSTDQLRDLPIYSINKVKSEKFLCGVFFLEELLTKESKDTKDVKIRDKMEKQYITVLGRRSYGKIADMMPV